MENQPNQQEPTSSKTSPALWVSIILVVIVLAVGAYFLFFQKEVANTNNTNTAVNTNAVTNANNNVNAIANSNTNSATNTNIDTSGWKTYENVELGFQLKYPSNWNTMVRQDGSIVFAPGGDFGGKIEVSIATSNEASTNVEVIKQSLTDSNYKDKTVETVMIDGISALEVSGQQATSLTDGTFPFHQRVIFTSSETVFQINGNDAQDVFNLMLDTLEVE